MVKFKKALLIAFAFLSALNAIAQTASASGNRADEGFMRSEGKIYVVMVVVITILVGLLLYIFRLDKKLSNLEKKSNIL